MRDTDLAWQNANRINAFAQAYLILFIWEKGIGQGCKAQLLSVCQTGDFRCTVGTEKRTVAVSVEEERMTGRGWESFAFMNLGMKDGPVSRCVHVCEWMPKRRAAYVEISMVSCFCFFHGHTVCLCGCVNNNWLFVAWQMFLASWSLLSCTNNHNCTSFKTVQCLIYKVKRFKHSGQGQVLLHNRD